MQDVDFFVGTFSKSLGAMGGFCVSSHPELNLVRYVSRPFIFTASSSPSIIASTRESLRQLQARPELRETLWRNARNLYRGFQAHGFDVGPEISPVVAVRLGKKEVALPFWNRLLENGVYTNLMIPPASPDQHSYIRCSVSAAHSEQQVERIIEIFCQVKEPS
jgi:8-amino-7-oxononanoate synthase